MIVPRFEWPAVQAILSLDTNLLEKLADEITKQEPVGNVKDLAANVSVAEVEPAAVEAILDFMASLSLVGRRQDWTPEELLGFVQRFFETGDKLEEWSDDSWNERKHALVSLLGNTSPIAYVSKVQELYRSHVHLLLRSQLLTDLRYVFQDEADSVKGGIVTNTLIIEYLDTGYETRTIEFTLDAEDITSLKKQIDRSAKKAEVAAKTLTDNNMIDFTPTEGPR